MRTQLAVTLLQLADHTPLPTPLHRRRRGLGLGSHKTLNNLPFPLTFAWFRNCIRLRWARNQGQKSGKLQACPCHLSLFLWHRCETVTAAKRLHKFYSLCKSMFCLLIFCEILNNNANFLFYCTASNPSWPFVLNTFASKGVDPLCRRTNRLPVAQKGLKKRVRVHCGALWKI